MLLTRASLKVMSPGQTIIIPCPTHRDMVNVQQVAYKARKCEAPLLGDLKISVNSHARTVSIHKPERGTRDEGRGEEQRVRTDNV